MRRGRADPRRRPSGTRRAPPGLGDRRGRPVCVQRALRALWPSQLVRDGRSASHTSRGGKTTTLGKCAASSTTDPGKCCECEEFKEARPCAECAKGAGGCVELCVENQLSKHVFIPGMALQRGCLRVLPESWLPAHVLVAAAAMSQRMQNYRNNKHTLRPSPLSLIPLTGSRHRAGAGTGRWWSRGGWRDSDLQYVASSWARVLVCFVRNSCADGHSAAVQWRQSDHSAAVSLHSGQGVGPKFGLSPPAAGAAPGHAPRRAP